MPGCGFHGESYCSVYVVLWQVSFSCGMKYEVSAIARTIAMKGDEGSRFATQECGEE